MIRAAALFALLAFFAACGPLHDSQTPAVPQIRVVVVPAGVAERPSTSAHVVFAEVAARRPDRERGLMGRTTLEKDHGMLFVYAVPVKRTFWMKDCRMGLDIAFIREDGRIAKLATLPAGAGLPLEEIPSAACDEPVKYVLEVAPGWFAAHGVREFDLIDVAPAAAGVEAD